MSDRPTVIVAVSPSPSGHEALRRGVREARLRGARLQLIRVWRDIDRFLSMSRTEAAALQGLERAEEEILADAVNRATELDPSVQVGAALVPGDLFSKLAAAAADAQLLVVGAGRTESGSAFIGEWCRLNSPCPVLIASAPILVGRG